MAEEDSITPEIIFADAAKAGLDVNRLKADMNDPAIQKTLDDSLALPSGWASTPRRPSSSTARCTAAPWTIDTLKAGL